MTRLGKITETHIKTQCKDYLKAKHIFNWPVLQGMGCYKGAPDRILHLNGEVIYLEIKKPTGEQSQAQIEFNIQCMEDGIKYWLVHSVDELIELIKWHPVKPPKEAE